MFNHTPQNRWQAFALHLLLSLGLFIAMCIIIVVFWYPGVLFSTEGGWQGVRLIASIDFVIGPILTLIVYKTGKPSLKFDLTVIGLLQAACISYGMYVVNHSRPAVVAYADGMYYTTPLLRFNSRDIDISHSSLLEGGLPVWVNIKLPQDANARLKIKVERSLKGLETSVDLYEPYTNALPLLATEGFSLQQAKDAGINVDGLQPERHRVYRLNTRYNTYAVAVDIQTGAIIKQLAVVEFLTMELVLKAASPLKE